MLQSPLPFRAGSDFNRLAFKSTIRSVKARGLVHLIAEDARFDGRVVTLTVAAWSTSAVAHIWAWRRTCGSRPRRATR